ncbi:MAG: sugar phosphate isomerase/epimerase family protein [Candidatus Hinthialibacter antarcticus]|nr:sugar phosphate isomerase/epimerase family protein [Candidatus Hinthialibacter antarcticus]
MTISISRRHFSTLAVAAAGAAVGLAKPSYAKEGVKMFPNLGMGHLRVSGDMKKSVEYAIEFGYGGVNPSVGELAAMSDAERDEFVMMMKAHQIQWGASGLPTDFRKDDETFKKGIQALPKQAKVLQDAGVTRVATWIMPRHNELTYRQNFRQHRNRLREAAVILKDHGMRLGLEFVGPQTMLVGERYPFIHTQKEMLELCDAIGTGNMGLLFDSWHWHSSGGTVDEAKQLTNDLVVNVHVNDAPKGVAREALIDMKRELPCTTGSIDMKGFINALYAMGYDGPVTVEPFNQPLWEMDDRDALKATKDSLDRVFGLIEV